MSFHSYFIIFILSVSSYSTFAQKVSAAKESSKLHSDMIVFHRLMMQTKEYITEKSKMPAIQKESGLPAKVKIIIDTNAAAEMEDDSLASTMVIGYINETIGENAANIYEFTFNRREKKIIKTQPTGDTIEYENAPKKTFKKANTTKKAASKTENDDEMDDDEAKPKKGKKEVEKEEE